MCLDARRKIKYVRDLVGNFMCEMLSIIITIRFYECCSFDDIVAKFEDTEVTGGVWAFIKKNACVRCCRIWMYDGGFFFVYKQKMYNEIPSFRSLLKNWEMI